MIAYIVCAALIWIIGVLCIIRYVRDSHFKATEGELLAQWEREYPEQRHLPIGKGGHSFRESPMYARYMVKKGRAIHDKHAAARAAIIAWAEKYDGE